MKRALTAAYLLLPLAPTHVGAQSTAPQPTFTVPHAYEGYAQPEISECSTDGALRRTCVVPAMTAGRYVVIAAGAANATGPNATQTLAILLNGQPCIATRPAPFTGKKGLNIACEVNFLTDKPFPVSAVYAVQNGEPDKAGPQLVLRRQPWNGVVDARGVVIQHAPAAPGAGSPPASGGKTKGK